MHREWQSRTLSPGRQAPPARNHHLFITREASRSLQHLRVLGEATEKLGLELHL